MSAPKNETELPTQVGLGKVVDSEQSLQKAEGTPVVEFKNVTKTYRAIQDLSFVVRDEPTEGEFVGILGPSGCGKSTVLKLIAGLEPQHPPTTGSVSVLGKPVSGPGADRGMVFQDYTSFDHRTVLDNVTFGLECHGVPRKIREELGRHWIEQVGLDVKNDQNKYPHELSGGMRQRVAIARSLILKPRANPLVHWTHKLD